MALKGQDLAQPALLGSDLEALSAKLLSLFLRTKGRRSEQTARVYEGELRRLILGVAKPLPQMTFEDLSGYADTLTHLAPASQARALATIRSLFRFGVRTGLLNVNPAEPLEIPKVDIRSAEHHLSRGEAQALLQAATRHSPKARAIVLLALTTGLRVSELAAASWADVYHDPSGRVGLTVLGKGGKRRSVKLRPDVVEALHAARIGDSEALLANRRGEHISARYIRRLVRILAVKGGIRKPISPHWLRHTAATLALSAGAPLLQVKEDLGHGSLATTQRYLHAVIGLEQTSADFINLEEV